MHLPARASARRIGTVQIRETGNIRALTCPPECRHLESIECLAVPREAEVLRPARGTPEGDDE